MHSPQAIPSTARQFLGVPFAHQGRSLHGLDCLGLLILTAQTLDLRFHGKPATALDEVDYSHRPDVARLYGKLAENLTPVSTDEMQPGDIALFTIAARAQHLGIIGDYQGPCEGKEKSAHALSLIHAYAPARKVVEHRFCQTWQSRVFQMFRMV